MKAMFLSEWVRFRWWALGFAIVHAGFLAYQFGFTSSEVLQPKLVLQAGRMLLSLLATVMIGFLFGLLQMALHKRANHWTYLIHRPLSPPQIYLSLFLAGASFLTIAICLPWVLTMAVLDQFTLTLVETRHYLHGLFLAGIAVGAYACGQLVQLHPSKGAVLSGVLILFPIGHPPFLGNHATPGGWVVFLMICVMLGCFLFLNSRAFKPDLQKCDNRLASSLLLALPMQLGILYFLFYSGGLTATLIERAFTGEAPPEEGTYAYFSQLPVVEGVRYILEKEGSPEALELVDQVALGDPAYCGALPLPRARRDQAYIAERQNQWFEDEETDSYWIFSHRAMLFKGVHRKTGGFLGWLGPNGFKDNRDEFTREMRFETVPSVASENLVQLPGQLLKIYPADRRVEVFHQLGEDEHYYGRIFTTDDYVSIASNKALYFFDRALVAEEDFPLTSAYRVPHPRPVEYISHIRTIRLVDGYLIRYSNDYLYGGGRPGVILVRMRLDGTTRQISARPLARNDELPIANYDTGTFSISPLLHALVYEGIWTLIEPGERRHSRVNLADAPLSQGWWIGLILIHLTCSSIVFFLSGKMRERSTRFAWILMCLPFGLPTLVSFLLMRPRPD